MIDSIEQEIRTLRSLFWSGRDPEGRAFAPLADAYRRAGDFRQAVELLTEGLDRHPAFTSAHVVAAQLYHEKGLTAEAELAFRRVLELDPDNVVALGLLAESLHGRGEADAAGDFLHRHRELEGLAPVAEEEAAEVAGPVVDLADLAPEAEAEPEPIVDLADLAPEAEPEPEPIVDLADLAPEAEAEPEPIMDLADLAPDVEAEPELVMDLADLAPDVEAEPELVMDLADLAPDVEAEPEPVMDLADLAPDVEAEPEPIMDLADLAPDVEAEPEPVVDLADLAPDVEAEPEPVMDLADLAPDDSDLLVGDIDAAPMVTRTMAELFVAQGLVDRALEVFRQLLDATPGDAGLRKRIAELSASVDGDDVVPDAGPVAMEEPTTLESAHDDDDLSGHAWDAVAQADNHDVDTPFAWTDQDADELPPAGPAISAYFSRMLSWEPGAPSAPDASGAAADAASDDQPTDRPNRDDT